MMGLAILLLLACLIVHVVTVASSSEADPFVLAAPLIVAAVCQDGVLLMAFHTSFHAEPLLLSRSELKDENKNETTSSSEKNITTIIRDLPRDFRGPFRIQSVDGFGTAMMSAGWRTDGHVLATHCRSTASKELKLYGLEISGTADYGFTLAMEASTMMAQRVVGQHSRPLRCAALLASAGDKGDAKRPAGFVWLIDATGAYRVRAHAIGGGDSTLLASQVNEYLAAMDCHEKTVQESCRELLEEWGGETTRYNLPARTKVEIGKVGPIEVGKVQRLQRLFSSSLFGRHHRKSLS